MRTLKILSIALLILGGLFLQLESRESKNSSDYQYLLVVKIDERKLYFYQLKNNEKKEIKNYPIAVPVLDSYLPLPLVGEIQKIELDPWWYPTEGTRLAYRQKKKIDLPKVIPPSHSLNTLGKAAFTVKFSNPDFKMPIRIHGTNDPQSIGQRITRGCIRLQNKDILELAQIIKNAKTQVIIEK